jgi:hypothetical protein
MWDIQGFQVSVSLKVDASHSKAHPVATENAYNRAPVPDPHRVQFHGLALCCR